MFVLKSYLQLQHIHYFFHCYLHADYIFVLFCILLNFPYNSEKQLVAQMASVFISL